MAPAVPAHRRNREPAAHRDEGHRQPQLRRLADHRDPRHALLRRENERRAFRGDHVQQEHFARVARRVDERAVDRRVGVGAAAAHRAGEHLVRRDPHRRLVGVEQLADEVVQGGRRRQPAERLHGGQAERVLRRAGHLHEAALGRPGRVADEHRRPGRGERHVRPRIRQQRLDERHRVLADPLPAVGDVLQRRVRLRRLGGQHLRLGRVELRRVDQPHVADDAEEVLVSRRGSSAGRRPGRRPRPRRSRRSRAGSGPRSAPRSSGWSAGSAAQPQQDRPVLHDLTVIENRPLAEADLRRPGGVGRVVQRVGGVDEDRPLARGRTS